MTRVIFEAYSIYFILDMVMKYEYIFMYNYTFMKKIIFVPFFLAK